MSQCPCYVTFAAVGCSCTRLGLACLCDPATRSPGEPGCRPVLHESVRPGLDHSFLPLGMEAQGQAREVKQHLASCSAPHRVGAAIVTADCRSGTEWDHSGLQTWPPVLCSAHHSCAAVYWNPPPVRRVTVPQLSGAGSGRLLSSRGLWPCTPVLKPDSKCRNLESSAARGPPPSWSAFCCRVGLCSGSPLLTAPAPPQHLLGAGGCLPLQILLAAPHCWAIFNRGWVAPASGAVSSVPASSPCLT